MTVPKNSKDIYEDIANIVFKKNLIVKSNVNRVINDVKALSFYYDDSRTLYKIRMPSYIIMREIYSMDGKHLNGSKDIFIKQIELLGSVISYDIEKNVLDSYKQNHQRMNGISRDIKKSREEIANVHDFVNNFKSDFRAICVERHYFKETVKHVKDDFHYSLNSLSGSLKYRIKGYENNYKKSLKLSSYKINSSFKDSMNKTKNNIYTDLITILGIFVAIMVAIFGGFQLFGNVFHPSISIGRSMITSSVILFGIYLILILLFNCITKLTRYKKYHFSVVFNVYLLSSFIILFLLGIIVSCLQIKVLHFYHLLYVFAGVIMIVIIIISNWYFWEKYR